MRTDAEWMVFDAVSAAARQRPERIEKLAYRAPGTMSVPAQTPVSEAIGAAAVELVPQAEMEAKLGALEERLRESERRAELRIEQTRREASDALEQARGEIQREAQQALEAGAGQIGSALESFHMERNDYFAKVEQEVVRLALAIAGRILNREAQFDPLLLAGAVRVALGQLGETTGVRLRCPIAEVERWRTMLEGVLKADCLPDVEGDVSLGSGDCVLETQLGTVELGVRAQLEEIERGFFDLLDRRPGVLSSALRSTVRER